MEITLEQGLLFAVIASAMVLFVWGRWRYDIVALLALLAAVYFGIVSPQEAFTGFGHPAVITVAAVLVIGRALQISGLVDYLVRLLAPAGGSQGTGQDLARGAEVPVHLGVTSVGSPRQAFMKGLSYQGALGSELWVAGPDMFIRIIFF